MCHHIGTYASNTQIKGCVLLIYQPQKDERLSPPSWLTCSGHFTHKVVTCPAVGRAQDSESSLVNTDVLPTVPLDLQQRDYFVGKLSAIRLPTRPTQPFILPGSINE